MSPAGVRLLAVDDEPGALADLARVLSELPTVAEVQCASDGDAALRRATTTHFDAAFLDVRMAGLDGIELARVLRRFADPPELVFVSAHDDAAVDAFELHALDYLRKPVARRRVAEAVTRVLAARSEPVARADERAPESSPVAVGPGSSDEAAFRVQRRAGGEHEVVAVSALRGGATRLLTRDEIRYASSRGDFVHIVTSDGRYLLRVTLAELERRWAPHDFARIHRQYVVNLRQAVELRPQLGGTAELAFADGSTVPVARRHAAGLARRLGM